MTWTIWTRTRLVLDRARDRWDTSDWSRMTGPQLATHVAGWAIFLFCGLVVVVTYYRALQLWPRPMRVATLAVVVAGTQQWLGYRRSIRVVEELSDRLDYAEMRDAPAADAYATDLLAKVGPITGPTPVVLFDFEADEAAP